MSVPRRFFDGIKVIDTDTHLTEPHDLWTARAPASYRDRVPQVKWVDGRRQWFVAGDVALAPASPASVVRKDRSKATGVDFFRWQIEDVHPASYDVKARLALMDELEIWAQIVYPNLAGFGNQRFLKMDDADLRNACVLIYNDAMAELLEQAKLVQHHGMAEVQVR